MKFFIEQLSGDNNDVVRVGQTETLEHAVMLAKRIIDEYLARHSRHMQSANALYTQYKEKGPIPCIFFDDGEHLNVQAFDPWDYASLECLKLRNEDPPSMLFVASFEEKRERQKYRHPLSGAEFYPSLRKKSDPSDTVDLRIARGSGFIH